MTGVGAPTAGTPHLASCRARPPHEPPWKATGCCPSSPDSRSARPCCGSEPSVFAMARARSLRSSRRLVPVALLLAGFGLWWPGHFLEPGEASGGGLGIPVRRRGLALALAGLAGATAVATTRKTLPAFAGLALLTLRVAYAHSLFATPGLFRASAAIGSWGPAGAILVAGDDAGRPRPGVQAEPQAPGRPHRRRAARRPAADPGRVGLGRSRPGDAAGLDRGAAARRPGRHRRRAARGPRQRRRAATPSRRGAPPRAGVPRSTA